MAIFESINVGLKLDNNISLNYQPSLSSIAAKFADRDTVIWLDSAHPYTQQGRFEILGLEARYQIRARGNRVELITSASANEIITDNAFNVIQRLLKQYPENNTDTTLPLTGGFLGYFSYDMGRLCEKIPQRNTPIDDFYDCYGGIYEWLLITDHQQQTTQLVGILDRATLQQKALMLEEQAIPALSAFTLTTSPEPVISKNQYAQSFEKIKDYIIAGDCYQVNLTQPFQAHYTGHPWHAYLALRENNPTPFAAYVNTGDYQILSCSPERFLNIGKGEVTTQPMKGTSKRHPDEKKDVALGQALLTSKKDWAENVMIVDLMRNDISRNCLMGSVKVPKLCELESFPQVHHLVSTVTGSLDTGKTALDLLRDSFPGGSITGTPKIRAMEIIEELEQQRRGIYCGSIGYIGFNGNMDTSIAIRTLHCHNNTMTISAGGAIVADSTCDAEYEECLTKMKAIFKTLKPFIPSCS